MERCTLATIAKTAKVSISTVSYALRNHPKISQATTHRIQRLARDLGYRPHPAVTALMSHIRSAHRPRQAEKIAFVWVEAKRTKIKSSFHRETIAGARARAELHGYEMEEFWLSDAGMTPLRLSGILKARGITGIVFSGCERETGVRLEMDWSAHAAAIIGNACWNPELHRAGHYHFMGMRRVLQEFARRGYRRPVALLDAVVNERANRAWEAAFMVFHPAPAQARTMVRKLAKPDRIGLHAWLARTQPDSIIVSKPSFVPSLRLLAREMGVSFDYAALDVLDRRQNLCGIDPGHGMVAANAVDLVIGQLFRNERGVPADPMNLLFEGHWVEGASWHL